MRARCPSTAGRLSATRGGGVLRLGESELRLRQLGLRVSELGDELGIAAATTTTTRRGGVCELILQLVDFFESLISLLLHGSLLLRNLIRL